jgi:hypothetical protein
VAFRVNAPVSYSGGADDVAVDIQHVPDFQHGEGGKALLQAFLVDSLALTACFRRCDDAVCGWVGGCWPVNVAQSVNRRTSRCVLFDPIKQHLPSSFKGLDVVGFLLRHEVGRDVDLNIRRCTLSGIEQKAMPCVEAVKGAPNQAALKAMLAFHGRGFCLRDMMSSPISWRRGEVRGAVPRHLTALFTVSSKA